MNSITVDLDISRIFHKLFITKERQYYDREFKQKAIELSFAGAMPKRLPKK